MTERGNFLPSFFVIGPPRTGTSWLHVVLQAHTRLPKVKETRFFDSHFQRGLSWYRDHYIGTDENLVMGEVAPTYFASPEARDRVAQAVPSAKILCIFRDPIDRIRSHYRLKRAYAMVPWSFEEALARDPELMESSRYATHFKAWQQALGPDNVQALLYDDMKRDPQSFIDAVADFIQIPRLQLTASEIQYVHTTHTMTQPRNYYGTRGAWAIAEWCKSHRFGGLVDALKRTRLRNMFLGGGPVFAEISPETAQHVRELLRPEIEELERVINRDLSVWKREERESYASHAAASAQLGVVS